MSDHAAALLDLVLPLECGGCARPGTRWCPRCRASLSWGPITVAPRVDPGVPVWALGSHVGAGRAAVIAAKEHGRRDLARPLGQALADALAALRETGDVDPPRARSLVLVPAPTRASAARRRGGDPVARMARRAARASPATTVAAILTMRPGVRDSVGLTAAQRRHNLAGRVRVRSPGRVQATLRAGLFVMLVDDVLTTGATAAESVRTLAAAGVHADGVLVVTAAGSGDASGVNHGRQSLAQSAGND